MSEIEQAARAYVLARAKRNKAKVHRGSFICSVQEAAEQDEDGRWISRRSAPCYIRIDEFGTCEACVKREAAHQEYLSAARDMGSAWRKLKRRVEKVYGL